MALLLDSTIDIGDTGGPFGVWDGLGNGLFGAGGRAGQFRAADLTFIRFRSLWTFDISSLTTAVAQASLNLFYKESIGNGVGGAAPRSATVGHVIVDHIEDYQPEDPTDYQAVAKTSNIGTLVGDDIAPQGWYSLDITAYVNADIAEADTPDTSCYRLRQSFEQNGGNRDHWAFDGLTGFISFGGGQIIRIQNG